MLENDWIALLSALLTPLVALIACYIGWRQWRTAELKRKQDLFDKRYDFFKKIWPYFADPITAPHRVPPTDTIDLLDYTHEAEFLFGDDIVEHLLSIPEKQKEKVLDYDWYSKPFKKYLLLK